jgi:acetoin utilization deacetylase AcuC-like enzyme
MGFCLFNNVAIAARELQAGLGLERVAIVDVDVHHGNGTQESFYEDPTLLFVSTHQYPFYPGSGALNEIGAGAGRGATVNLPLPAGCGDGEYRLAIERVIAPALRRFGPEQILVSLGFDAHWADPLAQMRLSIEGYVRIVERLAALADELCAGRLALVLEGGYSLEALGYGTLAVARALRGDLWDDPLGAPPGATPTDGQGIAPILDAARQIHGLDEAE